MAALKTSPHGENGESKMSIKYKSKLPTKVPGTLPVYRLSTPISTPVHVAKVSKGLGLEGSLRDFSLSGDWTSYREGRYSVSVHRRSGALHYRHRDKYGLEVDEEYKLSKKQSQRVAEDFLKRTKIVPVKQASLLRVTHLRSGTADTSGKHLTEKLLDAGVIFRRMVDGIQVEGPGGFAMVNIDPAGEVVGLQSVWRLISREEARVKIIPPSQAVEIFERRVAGLLGDTTVTSASFGYFEQGELERQIYLEPAYVFIYVVRNGRVSHKSIEVIAAGEITFAQLKGRKRFGSNEQLKREPSRERTTEKRSKSDKKRK